MIDFKKQVAEAVAKALEMDVKEIEISIENPKGIDNGDYAFPCFRLAKTLKKAPPIIATELKEKIEIVVFIVKKEQEAFQLFDSQNSRGKELIPQDYLKAYHLRAMRNELNNKQISIVEQWENTEPNEIKKLLEYFFRIYQWKKGESAKTLTVEDIDVYKGISEKSDYTYARRALKASPEFQINEPFISGQDFFKMIQHYIILKKSLKELPEENQKELKAFLRNKKLNNNTGFNHANELFECALIYYYDKFKNLNYDAISNIFKWSFYPRIEKKRLSFASINKYVLSNNNDFTNNINMFKKIAYSRTHTEISNINLNPPKEIQWNKELESSIKNLLKINNK